MTVHLRSLPARCSVAPPVASMDVSNVAAAKRHLVAAGCEIVRESAEDRALYFKDPFGVVWDVIEKKAQ